MKVDNKMNKQCISDYSSEEYSEKKKDERDECINRISLNFVKEFRNPAKDRYNQEKVKSLFKYLQERPDLQEMKVSGRIDDEKEDRNFEEEKDEEEIDEEEVYRYGFESYYGEDEETPRKGGQRFSMSRDFWYRTLNTLKAQKLDEAALETKDIPPSDKPKVSKCVRYLRDNKIFADEVPVTKSQVIEDIDQFMKSLRRRCEENPKKFIYNVYENRNNLLQNYMASSSGAKEFP